TRPDVSRSERRSSRANCDGAPAPGTAASARSSALREPLETSRASRVAQLAQRLRLDLPDTLARHREPRAHLFEGVVRALTDAEAQAEHLLLARRQGREDFPRLFL